MDFDNVMRKRHSIRKYSMKKVSFDQITEICEAARFAPMAGNIYTIKLIIVSDEKKKQELSEAALGQEFIVKASYIIVVCSNLAQLKRTYSTKAEAYARQQAGAAIQNILLKTTDLGLASCWIGAFDQNAIKRILRIPDDIQIECLLPIANSMEEPREIKKPDLKMILYFEEWGQETAKSEKKVPA